MRVPDAAFGRGRRYSTTGGIPLGAISLFIESQKKLLLEREVQEIDPDEHNHNTNDFIEYFAAHPCLVFDFFTNRIPQMG